MAANFHNTIKIILGQAVLPFILADAPPAPKPAAPPPPPTHTLAVKAKPNSGGTVSHSPDRPAYEPGMKVAITADPNRGYEFAGWSGGLTSAKLIDTVTMNKNLSLTANFAATPAAGGSSTAGTELKSSSYWSPYSGVTVGRDTYEFSALPGGRRWSAGYFGYAGYNGNWWTATEHDAIYVWGRGMNYDNENVDSDIYYKNDGFSVRCILRD